MKRRLFLLLFTLLTVGLFAQHYDLTATGPNGHRLHYLINTDDYSTVTICCGNECGGILAIPSTVTVEGLTYTVTAVADSAFYGSKIRGLFIPNTVTRIGDAAFGKCKRLKEVVMPEVLAEMGVSVFINDDSLISVELPRSLDSLPANTFKNCKQLPKIKLPADLFMIDQHCFAGCFRMNEVVAYCDAVPEIRSESFEKGNPIYVYVHQDMLSYFEQYWGNNPFVYLSAVEIALTTNNPEAGTVSGGGFFAPGDIVTIEAIPNEHYEFQYWSDGMLENPRTLVVGAQSKRIEAFFSPIQYHVVVGTNDMSRGSVRLVSDEASNYYADGRGSESADFNFGAHVVLEATPFSNYHFSGWSDGSKDIFYNITVTQSMNITALFVSDFAPRYQVTATSDNAVMGTTSGTGTFEEGSMARIEAVPRAGYRFVRWSDGDANASRNVKVTGVQSYIAYFAATGMVQYQLIATTPDLMMGSVVGSGRYNAGESVPVTATPTRGYHFVKWSDGETKASRIVQLQSDVTLVATFASDDAAVESPDAQNVRIFAQGGNIRVEGVSGRQVTVSTIEGRQIFSQMVPESYAFPIARKGVYMVHVQGLAPQRVLVW